MRVDEWQMPRGDKPLVHWPNPQDYCEAVQFPEVSFEDPELQVGEVELTPIGLPKVASGNFASVFQFNCGAKQYAVKCFLRNVYNQHMRYGQLTQFTMTTHVPHMVDFEYILKGIRVDENWFPIVKMEWVDGIGLDLFIRKNWSNRVQINRIINQFVEMMQDLQRLGVAHCDLQHGNILVKDNAIKLVDYDNMFVPAMTGEASAELGHANYQHLQRTERHFGPAVDNFSAWIIYYSLYFLRLDSSLWQRFSGGDDCLLFRRADFSDPLNSRLLNCIKSHEIPDIRAQYQPLMELLYSPIDNIPTFGFRTAYGAAQQGTVYAASAPQAEAFAPVSRQGEGAVRTGDNYAVPSGGQAQQPAQAHNQQAAYDVAVQNQTMSGTWETYKAAPAYPDRWPRAEDFFWAAVKPKKCYTDEKLARGVPVATRGKTTMHVEVDANTQWSVVFDQLVIKGRHHMVFHVIGESQGDEERRQYAVKCFLSNIPDRHLRYSAIHKHKKNYSNRYFVPFLYQPNGIKVGEHSFPILKMLWVQGETLDDYVAQQLRLGNTGAIEELLPKFVALVKALNEDGIAHGDLEPRNIIVDESGNLKIVDYDAMYVPALANLQSCELGMKAYQHPARNIHNYGNYLDNYSSLAIYGLLSCMARRPPERFWNFETMLQHIRSQPLQLRGAEGRLQKRSLDGGMRLPKQKNPESSVDSIFNPVFEKVSAADYQTSTFENSMQKLGRVLQEQQKRRIDQVLKLDVTLWNLT